jgi:hypothetical protein
MGLGGGSDASGDGGGGLLAARDAVRDERPDIDAPFVLTKPFTKSVLEFVP